MLKLTFLLVIGIGAAMVVAGRDLSPEEMADLGIEPRVEVARATPEPLLIAATPEGPQVPTVSDASVAETADAGTDTLTTPAEPAAPEPEPVEVVAAEPEPQPVPAEVAAVEPEADPPTVADEIAAALSDAQVWYVNAQLVNVRDGPSTEFPVVNKVAFGDAIEILSDPEAEWVKIRIQGDGVEGYIARRFLQDSEPNG